MNKIIKNMLFAFGMTVAITSAANATVIDTTASATSTITAFGAPDTATYGETFTVGTDTILNSFSLYLSSRAAGNGALDLRGYVASWDGSKATNILYTSATVKKNASSNLQEFTFNTDDLTLISGSQYVAFLSVSGLGSQGASTFAMPSGGNVYSGGNFVYLNNGTNFTALTTSNWTARTANDVAFKATLSQAAQVPEPTTVALLGLGLLGFAVSRRKSNAK